MKIRFTFHILPVFYYSEGDKPGDCVRIGLIDETLIYIGRKSKACYFCCHDQPHSKMAHYARVFRVYQE